ncbi:MAG: divalent metal cation transporter [Bacteroidales bacterium]|nr:divalent metal cation transporter [Bacteroidales bacterium]
MPPPSNRPAIRIGPGALVTAAFIGPGTITTCTLAGARFGYVLLWGMVFSVLATIILQEMAARLGIISKNGLGEALRAHFDKPVARLITAILVVSAITIGNAAFQTGNLLGASMGLEALFSAETRASAATLSTVGVAAGTLSSAGAAAGTLSPAGAATGSLAPSDPATIFASQTLTIRFWVALVAATAFLLLLAGSYKLIERVLIALVILMSLTFLTTAIIVSPELPSLLRGMFVPTIPAGAVLTLVGLIGTTVVPYNLFLHASAVQERWHSPSDLPAARWDISVSMILGGVISMAVIVTASAAFAGTGTDITSGTDMARQLEPLAGRWAKYIISIGLFAAGISSSITAPMAAAYATAGIMGWKRDLRSARFRMIWMFILLAGVLFAMLGFKPVEAILFAQVANGILLPVIAVYLLVVMNSTKIMGDNVNGLLPNILGGIVVLIATGLGIRSILHVIGII